MTRPPTLAQWMQLNALLLDCLAVASGEATATDENVWSRLYALPYDQREAMQAYVDDLVAKLDLPPDVSGALFELMPIDRGHASRMKAVVELDLDAMELADRLSG